LAEETGASVSQPQASPVRPPMIRKISHDNAAYSVVEFNGARWVFARAVASGGGDLQQQADDALRTIDGIAREEGVRGSILQQAIFLGDIRQVETCRGIVRDFYGEQLPATSYVPQPPCAGGLLEIEVLAIGPTQADVAIRRLSERTVTARHNGITWVHCANVVPETLAEPVRERALDAFGRLERELAAWGFRFDQVARTWLYLGDITGLEGQSPRYQRLNLARTDFYQNQCFADESSQGGSNRVCYPASTGIGADGRDVMISCLGLATNRRDVLRLPLENPRQIAAHDYDHRYGPQSPKFSRAMAIVTDGAAVVLVSGTASIIDSESHHVGDVAAQTRETLDNIAALISADNFCRHGQSGLGATLNDVASLRVYVKRKEDYAAIQNACRARLADVPAVYAVADLCRPELLVEIEAIAFCDRA
jgi:enamine deaminase RidA (YjgF/YER057c/UK114 family)